MIYPPQADLVQQAFAADGGYAVGDKKKEAQEVFYVNLSGAAGALITTSQGTGVVKNDD